MKKRIMAVVMMLLVVFSGFAITASAKTKTKVLHNHDKWVYSTSITTGKYKSEYNDCTSSKYCSYFVGCTLEGGNSHKTRVTNNKDGLTSGWVQKPCGCKATATVKANWFGADGTASIRLGA